MQKHPEKYSEMLALWDKVSKIAKNENLLLDDGIQYIKNAVLSGRFGHPFLFEEKPTDSIDRTKEIFLGPVFSSKKYPWPTHKKKPKIPLIQIDLDISSKKMSRKLPSGLLQVWCGHQQSLGTEIEVRFIPKLDVCEAELTSIPDIPSTLETLAPIDWYQPTATKPNEATAYQIAGYGPAFFVLQAIDIWSYELPKEIETSCADELDALSEIFEYAKQAWAPRDMYLGGTFRPIQYSEEGRLPLVCFNTNDYISFGHEGNAQIFAHPSRHGVGFSFDWSV